MAMTKIRHLAKFVFLLSCFYCVAPRAYAAAGQCSAGGQKAISALNPLQIVSQISGIGQLGGATVQSVQSCLAVRGCYANDPKEIDGIVGPFTTAALYRSVYNGCLPPPSRQVCGDGQEPYSFDLTEPDIATLEKPPVPDAAADGTADGTADDAQGSADAAAMLPEQPAGPPPMSQELKDGLAGMKDVDYPNGDLFWNALDFFTRQKLNSGETPATKQDTANLDQELTQTKPAILQQACKIHSPQDASGGWTPDWNANMIYTLSGPVYGFYPFWISSAATPAPASAAKPPAAAQPPIDFGAFERIGWEGVTFTNEGNLQLDPIQQNQTNISRQIEVARRFRTSVDLVVFKQMSPAEWIDIAYSDSSHLVDNLSKSISDTVGQRQPGFLNSLQYWALPGLLTSPTTAWDGVTLDLVNFPYNDPVAMRFLTSLLTHLRQALQAKEERKTVWSSARQRLDLNLIVPFDAFVPPSADSSSDDTLTQNTTLHLAQFVPKHPCFLAGYDHCDDETGIVDTFIVFLPQSAGAINNEGSGETKKQLRGAIEDSFGRSPYILAQMKYDPSLQIASWRYEMLRRVTYILEPGNWSYKGDYPQSGSQFFDDMVYAKDNFNAVGFWPMPDYSAEHTPIAKDTRDIFRRSDQGGFQNRMATTCEKLVGVPAANFFGGWRRELAFAIEMVYAALALYVFGSFWMMSLREFYYRHTWLFLVPAAIAMAVLVLLCLFDRSLRDFAEAMYVVLLILIVGGFFARQYFLRSIERDLP
jgi:hypothetical protein